MRLCIAVLCFFLSLSAWSDPLKCLKNPFPKTKLDELKSGRKGEGGLHVLKWGAIERNVNLPTTHVYRWLLKHENWKDMEMTELATQKVSSKKPYSERHIVDVALSPVSFITVKWQEEWGYEVTKGTKAQPQEFVIRYRKKAGTSHIKHLCGEIVVKRLASRRSQIRMYEECECSHTTPKRVAKDLNAQVEKMQIQGIGRK